MSTTATPNGLEEKVAVSLARFDKAVKESNTWSTSLYGTRVRPKNTEFTRDTDSNTQLGDSAGSRFRGESSLMYSTRAFLIQDAETCRT